MMRRCLLLSLAAVFVLVMLATAALAQGPAVLQHQFARSGNGYGGTTTVSTCPAFEGGDKLVDLEVKDVPLREAMEKISKASRVAIEVDEMVPKGIKVSATIRKLPLGELLSLLVNQANLTCTVEHNPDREVFEEIATRAKEGLVTRMEFAKQLRDAPQVATIHIVPKPELKVTGVPPSLLPDPNKHVLGLRALEQLGGEEALQHLRFATMAGDTVQASLFITCPKCERLVLRGPEWKYCPHCGSKLPAPTQEKAEQ